MTQQMHRERNGGRNFNPKINDPYWEKGCPEESKMMITQGVALGIMAVAIVILITALLYVTNISAQLVDTHL